MSFRLQRRVDFCDTDLAGIVHFANFFRYMEAAEVAFLKSRGLNVSLQWNGEHLGFPRVAVSCDYVSPAKFDDVLDIDVRLEKLGTKSVTYAFDFSRDGSAIACGKMTSVCCRVGPNKTMEAIEMPNEIRTLIESP